jgi:hypothetical protein
MRVAHAKGTIGPLVCKFPERNLPFRSSQVPPFHLSHEQLLAVIGIRRDQVQFDVPLPISLGAVKLGRASVFENRGSVVMDEFPL